MPVDVSHTSLGRHSGLRIHSYTSLPRAEHMSDACSTPSTAQMAYCRRPRAVQNGRMRRARGRPPDSIHPELSTSMHDERLLRPAAQTRQREQSKRKHVRATMAIGAWPAPELPYRAVSGVRCRARGGWRGTYIKGACAGLAPSNLPVSRQPALTRFLLIPHTS